MSRPPQRAEPPPPQARAPTIWRRARLWLLGLLILGALVAASMRWTELEHFAQLVREARPEWILAALALQTSTYFLVASVWYVTLRKAGRSKGYWPLVPLGLAKLFSDQALPSGGLSGHAFFVAALTRRRVPRDLCMAVLLVSIVSFHAAYQISAFVSIGLLAMRHKVHASLAGLTVIFTLFTVAVPVGALVLHKLSPHHLPPRLARLKLVADMLSAFADAPAAVVRNPAVLVAATLLQGAVFVADAATLYVLLYAIGQPASFLVVFPSFVVASMVATMGLVPLGLGTFETSAVLMLRSLGVQLEAALTGVLLLRGFMLWLPMLPGLWLTRRALQ